MDTPQLSFRKLKELACKEFSVFAASGLVKVNSKFYVISDDESALFRFAVSDHETAKIPLLDVCLSEEPRKRKKQKPDWESLVHFPAFTGIEGLLAIPSGSTEHRLTGVFFEPNTNQITKIDFRDIYSKLQQTFPELNVEGGAILPSSLILLQRGNGASAKNAVISLDLKGLIADLKSTKRISDQRIVKIASCDLGAMNGLPLSFTDLACYNDELYFLAVAEDTTSTYLDGEFKGAQLGQLNLDGSIGKMWRMNCPFKPEGLWIENGSEGIDIYVVTDADSRSIVSSLYQATLQP